MLSSIFARILLVFSDKRTSQNLFYVLKRLGIECLPAEDGSKALALLESEDIDLVISQLNLQALHASDFCRSVRERSTVPIIVVADSNEEYDELACLEAGADDYLTGRCSEVIFVARLRALLRRVTRDKQSTEQTLVKVGEVTLDRMRLVATCKGSNLRLTPTEFKILGTLSHKFGQTLSREELLKEVWQSEYGVDKRLVDAHVRNLRARMSGSDTELAIVTVRGVGYRLVAKNKMTRRKALHQKKHLQAPGLR